MANEIVKSRGTSVAARDYIESQQALLALFNMHGIYALENYEVTEDESGRKKLRKRSRPMKFTPLDDNHFVVAGIERYSRGRIMFGDKRREEDRLDIMENACSLEVKDCLDAF